jgi:hypothetical protein
VQEILNLQFNTSELPNLFLAFFLSVAVWNGSFQATLLALFTYCSLHFHFAVYPVFGEAAEVALAKLHVEGGGRQLNCLFYFSYL